MRKLSNTIAFYLAYLGVSMPSTSLNTKGYLTFQGKKQKAQYFANPEQSGKA
jgi:hypothetical protein